MENDLFGNDAVKEPDTFDLVVREFNLGTLKTNAIAIRDSVKRKLVYYKNKSYTEDDIKEAQKDRATLNKSAVALNSGKIELRKQWMKPFDDALGNIIDEAVADIKETSTTVDTGIKTQEEKDKQKKKQDIEAFFASLNCEHFQLTQIFNPAWLNKTYKMKDIESEITAKIAQVKSDLLVLSRMGESGIKAQAHYLISLNLQSAIEEADRIKANEDRLAAIEKARQEREAARLAEMAKHEAETTAEEKQATETSIPIIEPKPEPVAPIVQETISRTETVQSPEVEPIQFYERSFKVKATKEKIIALSQWLDAEEIDWTRIE